MARKPEDRATRASVVAFKDLVAERDLAVLKVDAFLARDDADYLVTRIYEDALKGRNTLEAQGLRPPSGRSVSLDSAYRDCLALLAGRFQPLRARVSRYIGDHGRSDDIDYIESKINSYYNSSAKYLRQLDGQLRVCIGDHETIRKGDVEFAQTLIRFYMMFLTDPASLPEALNSLFPDQFPELADPERLEAIKQLVASGSIPGSQHAVIPPATEVPRPMPDASVSERARWLFDYARKNPHAQPFPALEIVFPELGEALASGPSLPEQAPALWAQDKLPGDTPVSFIQQHYAPWLGKGLTRPDIKRLDPQLYTALNNWLRHPDHRLPDGFDLPTQKEANDRWVAKIEAEGRPNTGSMTAREASRMRSVLTRRRSRAGHQDRAHPPEAAPAVWASDRLADENPVAFFRRVYEPWSETIAKPDIRRLDRGLYQAMATWVRRHPDDDPHLPTSSDLTSTWIESVQSGDEPTPEGYKDRERLRSAVRRRQKSDGQDSR